MCSALAEREASFGREVRFARDVCLRHDISGTLNFTLRQSRKTSRLPKANTSHRAKARYFTESPRTGFDLRDNTQRYFLYIVLTNLRRLDIIQ